MFGDDRARLEDIHVSHGATSSLYQYRGQNACQFHHSHGAMQVGNTPRTVMINTMKKNPTCTLPHLSRLAQAIHACTEKERKQYHVRISPRGQEQALVKSQASLWRGLAVVSVAVGILFVASKRGKAHQRTDPRRTAVPPQQSTLALKEGQTIVAVSETTHAMCFSIGNEAHEA